METLAAAEEALKAEVCSLVRHGVDDNRKGLLEDILVPPVVEEIMAGVQEREKLIPQER